MEDPTLKKLLRNDEVFNTINKKFITLQSDEEKRNNNYLLTTIHDLLQKMMEKDPLFKKAYQRIMFGGSYYKGTKVGNPEEYDLNVVIKLPINYQNIKFQSELAGHVMIYSGLNSDSMQIGDPKINKILAKLLDKEFYLDREKFQCWFESVISKTVKDLPASEKGYLLEINESEQFHIKFTKSGPAFTLHVYFEQCQIDVDLVPVLEFSKPLLQQEEKLAMCNKKNWFAVPKPLKNVTVNAIHRYWRLCFYEQEKEILTSNSTVKPVLRQLKKLRDSQNMKSIASYYIETLCLHEIRTNKDFGKNTSNTFMFFHVIHFRFNTIVTKCTKEWFSRC